MLVQHVARRWQRVSSMTVHFADTCHACHRRKRCSPEPDEWGWHRLACCPCAGCAKRHPGVLPNVASLFYLPYGCSLFCGQEQVGRFGKQATEQAAQAAEEAAVFQNNCGLWLHARQVVDAFDPNSSASEADLRQGDILSRVDGVDVIGMPVPTVAEKIFGPVGSPVSTLCPLDITVNAPESSRTGARQLKGL